ncbi:MAG TPA: hypothetical protein VK961_00840 [Chthoniobacter sp.]|nr:hypothetical protein [Chthoniobacter sp.]
MNAKLSFLSVVCFAAVSGASATADLDLGSPTSRTPYDNYLDPVFRVFRQLDNGQVDPSVVEQLVREGRNFRYYYNKDQPYLPQAPEVTESTKTGDCKAKSLWLASKMNTRNVRFVIGKLSLGSAKSHAWLIWQGPQGWLILDATNYSKPLVPDRVSPSELVPTYSYSPSGKYAHATAAAARGGKYGDHL